MEVWHDEGQRGCLHDCCLVPHRLVVGAGDVVVGAGQLLLDDNLLPPDVLLHTHPPHNCPFRLLCILGVVGVVGADVGGRYGGFVLRGRRV